MSELDNLQNADGKKENIEASKIKTDAAADNTTENNTDADIPEGIDTQEASKELSEDDAINEIEASNAEDAEDEGNKERHTIKY